MIVKDRCSYISRNFYFRVIDLVKSYVYYEFIELQLLYNI